MFSVYSTSKRVLLKSRTLNVLLFVSFSLIILVQVILIWAQHRYATFESPMGLFNSWSNSSWVTKSTPSSFCSGMNGFAPIGFDVTSSAGIMGLSYSCPQFTNPEIIQIADKSVSAVSSLTRVINHPDCAKLYQMDFLDPVNSYYAKTYLDPDTGVYENCVNSYFVDGIENIPIYLITGITTSFLSEVNIPTTLVHQDGSEIKSFAAGDSLQFTVNDFLQAAGISLDDINEPQAFQFEPGWEMKYRHSGVVLIIEFEYTNLRTWDFLNLNLRCEIRVSSQKSAWGYIGIKEGYTENGAYKTTDFQYAVRLQFFERGELGTYDGNQLLTEIFNTLILLFSAKVIVELVAKLFIQNWSVVTLGSVDANERAAARLGVPGPQLIDDGPLKGFVIHNPAVRTFGLKKRNAASEAEVDATFSRRTHFELQRYSVKDNKVIGFPTRTPSSRSEVQSHVKLPLENDDEDRNHSQGGGDLEEYSKATFRPSLHKVPCDLEVGKSINLDKTVDKDVDLARAQHYKVMLSTTSEDSQPRKQEAIEVTAEEDWDNFSISEDDIE